MSQNLLAHVMIAENIENRAKNIKKLLGVFFLLKVFFFFLFFFFQASHFTTSIKNDLPSFLRILTIMYLFLNKLIFSNKYYY